MKYLVQYTEDYSSTLRYSTVEAPMGSNWRDLQEIFDPRYFYNNLKFYPVGNEVVIAIGE